MSLTVQQILIVFITIRNIAMRGNPIMLFGTENRYVVRDMV